MSDVLRASIGMAVSKLLVSRNVNGAIWNRGVRKSDGKICDVEHFVAVVDPMVKFGDLKVDVVQQALPSLVGSSCGTSTGDSIIAG